MLRGGALKFIIKNKKKITISKAIHWKSYHQFVDESLKKLGS